MSGNWDVRQAMSQQVFKVTTFYMDTCSGIFATDQLHRTPHCGEIQPMQQQATATTRLYRALVLNKRAFSVACSRRGNRVMQIKGSTKQLLSCRSM